MATKPKPKSRNQRVAATRLAKLRVADPNSVPDVKPTAHGNFHKPDRYAILNATRKVSQKKAATKAAPKPAAPFDPLKPLAGADFDNEVAGRTALEFGPEEAKLRDATIAQTNREPVVSNALDQYHQALIDATARSKKAADDYVAQSQGAVDTSYTQDKASQDERDKATAMKAALAGQAAAQAPSQGQQAVEGARGQGNQAVANERTSAAANNTMMEGRVATSLQAKAGALQHEGDKRTELERQGKDLAARKGAYATAQRGDLTDKERTFALASKEFDLKDKATTADIAATKAKTAADKQASNAQVLVAKIYNDADKAKAAATVRVAKLQLDKGKIDQKQYRQIVNIYKGLPKKGTATPAKTNKPKGSGSGPDGSLAPWEIDARDRAYTGFGKNKYTASDHARAIVKAVSAGIPKRLAEAAWKRYVKTLHAGPVVAPDSNGQQRPT